MEHIANMLESNFNRVFAELQEVRKELADLKNEPAPNSAAPAPQAAPVQQAVQRPTPQQPAFHQRTGGYKPEDVAIEKFFYAGQK